MNSSQDVTITELPDRDRKLWDEYVTASKTGSVYHLIAWKDVIEESFGHRTHYLMATAGTEVVGVLPLVFMHSTLFGRFLVSMPFFNYGGICADHPAAARLLLNEAMQIASRERATHIELRHSAQSGLDLASKTAKAAMLLDLPGNADALWQTFRSKLRSQIRRAEREAMEVRIGGLDCLDGFYDVFATNMRALGTPVYGKRFFRTILNAFPTKSRIVNVRYGGRVIASGFLIAHGTRVEIPWASSIRAYNALAPNMLLYWHALKFACEGGYAQFDFGRSTIGSSTYTFKQQWGAQPLQLYWEYWLQPGFALPELSPRNPKYRLFIAAWKRLPLGLTRLLGPHIVRNIP